MLACKDCRFYKKNGIASDNRLTEHLCTNKQFREPTHVDFLTGEQKYTKLFISDARINEDLCGKRAKGWVSRDNFFQKMIKALC